MKSSPCPPITIEEALALQGTDFTYYFNDGDSMLTYVKKFDPEVGLSCWAYSFITDRDGHVFKPKNAEEFLEGACCNVSYNMKTHPHSYAAMMQTLAEIKHTRSYTQSETVGSFAGCSL